jgi:hypothetical protein
MSEPATNLFILENFEEEARTSGLARSDVDALRAIADWIRSYVIKPHQDLGRTGPVCPFVPRSLERRVLWLAPEHIGDRDAPGVAEVLSGYQRLLLDTQPADGEDVAYKVIVVVFTDLAPDRAPGVFDDILQQIAVPEYAESGIVFGPFYPGHQGTAIYNSSFHPFRSPVPFMFVRHGVVDDWKFFLESEDFFPAWARRFGESGAQALGEELRHLPWRVSRG